MYEARNRSASSEHAENSNNTHDLAKLPEIEADAQFQKRMRISFIKGNLNKYEEISDAINSGDIELAHRLAHSLKSNAGHIGKSKLQKAAAEVEELLKRMLQQRAGRTDN